MQVFVDCQLLLSVLDITDKVETCEGATTLTVCCRKSLSTTNMGLTLLTVMKIVIFASSYYDYQPDGTD